MCACRAGGAGLDLERARNFGIIGLTIHGPFFFHGFKALDTYMGPAQSLGNVSPRDAHYFVLSCPVSCRCRASVRAVQQHRADKDTASRKRARRACCRHVMMRHALARFITKPHAEHCACCSWTSSRCMRVPYRRSAPLFASDMSNVLTRFALLTQALRKTAAGQLTLFPTYLGLFFAAMGALEGRNPQQVCESHT